jgi:hypothetical protein
MICPKSPKAAWTAVTRSYTDRSIGLMTRDSDIVEAKCAIAEVVEQPSIPSVHVLKCTQMYSMFLA